MKRLDSIWKMAIGIAILLAIAGKLLFAQLFGFFEPHVDGIDFQIRELDRFVNTSTLFSLFLLIMPLLVALMWKRAALLSIPRKIISLVIILLFITIGIILRHYQVKNYFARIVRPYFIAKGQMQVNYPIDPLNFIYYISVGFCIGFIVSWAMLKQKIK